MSCKSGKLNHTFDPVLGLCIDCGVLVDAKPDGAADALVARLEEAQTLVDQAREHALILQNNLDESEHLRRHYKKIASRQSNTILQLHTDRTRRETLMFAVGMLIGALVGSMPWWLA
jgi:hypothetical protein